MEMLWLWLWEYGDKGKPVAPEDCVSRGVCVWIESRRGESDERQVLKYLSVYYSSSCLSFTVNILFIYIGIWVNNQYTTRYTN